MQSKVVNLGFRLLKKKMFADILLTKQLKEKLIESENNRYL